MVDYGSAVKRPFTNWKNFLIGFVLSIIPIVNWIAKGYIVTNAGVGKKVDTKKLPDFKNWGDLFVKGFLAWLIGVIYMVPAGIFMMIGAGAIIGTLIGGAVGPFGGLIGEQQGAEFAQLFSQQWPLIVPKLITFAPILIVAVLLGIVAAFLTPVAILNFVKKSKFGDAFAFSDITKKAFTGDYFIVWLVTLVISVIIMWILNYIPVVGSGLGMFITGVFAYTAIGEVFNKLK